MKLANVYLTTDGTSFGTDIRDADGNPIRCSRVEMVLDSEEEPSMVIHLTSSFDVQFRGDAEGVLDRHEIERIWLEGYEYGFRHGQHSYLEPWT